MSETKNGSRRNQNLQAGSTAVEFSLVVIIFLTFVFGIVELARAVYVVNTLFEVTRRAAKEAANSNFDGATRQAIQQKAIFRTSTGPLVLGDPVNDLNVHIDYMSLELGAGGSLTPTPMMSVNIPSSPANNRLACYANPYSAQCVRLVRVRVCAAADSTSCTPLRFQSMLPLIAFSFNLPSATTIVMAETLGYTDGMLPSP